MGFWTLQPSCIVFASNTFGDFLIQTIKKILAKAFVLRLKKEKKKKAKMGKNPCIDNYKKCY